MAAAEPHSTLSVPTTPPPTRPKFNSRLTSDRLREGSFIKTHSFISASTITKDRKSVFREIGLDDDEDDGGDAVSPGSTSPSIPTPSIVVSGEPPRDWLGVTAVELGQDAGLGDAACLNLTSPSTGVAGPVSVSVSVPVPVPIPAHQPLPAEKP